MINSWGIMEKVKHHLLAVSVVFLLFLSFCVVKNPGFAGSEDPLYTDPDASPEERASDLLSRMTLEEKIGQMTQVDRGFLESDTDISEYNIGSILSGGGSTPDPNTPQGWVEMYNRFQKQAVENTRLGIPIIYGTDAVHGHNNLRGAVIFPHNVGMGATWNPELVERSARITASEVSATGVDWTFSPVVDVARDDRWGRTYESFGEDPYLCKRMGISKIKGYQGENLQHENTILATAKHYVGSGGTAGGEDQGNFEKSMRILREKHLPPFRGAVESGVGAVMASFCSVQGKKIHGREDLLTGVLKEEFGFDGFLVSDWAGIDQVDPNYSDAVDRSINAGIDMNMVPDDYKKFQSVMKDLVEKGEIPLKRIDSAVHRILVRKFQLGLFEDPYVNVPNGSVVGSERHRQVARQAVRESMVLLKNDGILPLSENSSIFVTGMNADDGPSQCGGWTLEWQGAGTKEIGTTVLEAIKKREVAEVEYSNEPSEAKGHDVAIAVMGESPYAEGRGDANDLSLSYQLNKVDEVVSTGVPTVVVMISGRPRTGIESRLDNWDGFLMAWLPGTEGDGVADVLFGDYNPSGELPRSWLRDVSQEPINYDRRSSESYDPLFEFGYGLSYTDFEYEDLDVSPEEAVLGDNLSVEVNVSNVGDRSGSEVVQLYARDVDSSVPTPEKKLYRFDKIDLAPGESKTVEFEIPVRELGYYRDGPDKVLEPGTFEIQVGGPEESFEVSAPEGAEFVFSNLQLDATQVGPGEEVKISFDVKNVGGMEGENSVKIAVGDNVLIRHVSLESLESETVSFTVSMREEGSYTVKVGELRGIFSVVEEDTEDIEDLLLYALTIAAISGAVIGVVWWWKKRG